LCGQIDDNIKFFAGKNICYLLSIRNVCLDKGEVLLAFKQFQAVIFQIDVIIVIQIIKAAYSVTPLKQSLGEVKADEAGGAGYEGFMHEGYHLDCHGAHAPRNDNMGGVFILRQTRDEQKNWDVGWHTI